jgi:glycosyltransferase involved in cell wall biosynthesis
VSTAASHALRVLLVSPRTRGDRYSGEDAYTDGLLAAPPGGVEYVHYEDLIDAGRARRVRWLSRLLPRLSGLLRPRGPIWFESVATEESFDLVHIHGFSGYLGGRPARNKTPVLLSESSLDLENLVDYSGWSRADVERFARAKRIVLRSLRIYDQTLNLRDARHLTVWSEWARRLHRQWGVPDSLMSVIPPHVPDIGGAARADGPPDAPHFLFVGIEFARKNGPAVIEAFHEVRRTLPAARLTIVGEWEADRNDPAAGIRHIKQLPRARLLGELYPSADVFVLPSRAEGYGVAVVEAMSAGLPCVVSGYGALPEVVGDAGKVVEPVTAADLAAAMTDLGASPERRRSLGSAARARYERCWTREYTTEALAARYRQVIGGK